MRAGLSLRDRSSAPPGRAGGPVPTRTLLLSAYGQAVDADCGRGHAAAEFQVAAYLGDIVEHVLEITGYRDLFYGIGEFAIDDPHAGGSARVIAGYQVGAVAEKLGYVEAVFDLRDNLVRRFRSRFEEVISRSDAGGAGESAGGVGGGLQAQLLRRVGIQQIRLQNSVLDHYRAAGGNAFAIEGCGAEATGHSAVIDYGDVRSGNCFA